MNCLCSGRAASSPRLALRAFAALSVALAVVAAPTCALADDAVAGQSDIAADAATNPADALQADQNDATQNDQESLPKEGEAAPAQHTVTFEYPDHSLVSQTVADGEKAVRPADPASTSADFRFVGWSTDAGALNLFDFSTPVTSDFTLYAYWTDASSRRVNRVTFDTGDGSAVEDQVIEEGAAAACPADPTREGYVFVGWYLDGEAYDFSQPVTAPIALTAKWEKVSGGQAAGAQAGEEPAGEEKSNDQQVVGEQRGDQQAAAPSAAVAAAKSASVPATGDTAQAPVVLVGVAAVGAVLAIGGFVLLRRRG